MNNYKDLDIEYSELKNWWVQGNYLYHSLHFPTQKYINGFISNGNLEIIHNDFTKDVTIKYNIIRKDTIKHMNIKEEIYFKYIDNKNIICFNKNSLGSYSDNIKLIKLDENQIILTSDDYKSETLNKTLINERKFIINKKKYGYFIEDLIKINGLWVAKGYSKYKFIL